jgi:CHAD domain-containing protein
MLEREHKYDVGTGFVLPDLSDVDGVAEVTEAAELTLEATYFDTPDHRLAAAGVSLRRRTGGEDDGWHLKLPSAVEPGARHELRIGLGRAVRTVPKRFRSTVAGLSGGQDLSAVATIRTRRTVRRLLGEEGEVLAEVADDAVEAVGYAEAGRHESPQGPTRPKTWREVEVELVGGDAAVLSGVGERLAETGAKRTSRQSKVEDLVGGQSTGPVGPSGPEDPVQLLVQHRLATQLKELQRRDPLVRENLPEGVHTMRVGVRRLRAALATGRPFLDRSVTDPQRDELAWLQDALGEARDAEVLRTRLDAAIDTLVEDRPDVDWEEDRARRALSSSLVSRHEQAVEVVGEVLAGDRYAALTDRLRVLVADIPWTDQAEMSVRDAYRPRVKRALRRLRKRMGEADDPSLADDERELALHEARKAAKRARYAVEPLRPIYGDKADKLTKRLKKLQSKLGQLQDTVVTRTYLVDLSRSQPALDPAAALLAGALVERESLAAERYERRARKAWGKLAGMRVPK